METPPFQSVQTDSSITPCHSKVAPMQLNGGTVKIVDSCSFPVSTAIAVADIFLDPGAIRIVVIIIFPTSRC